MSGDARRLVPDPDDVRVAYEEYHTEDGVVAVVSDSENPRAWIRSNVNAPVEP